MRFREILLLLTAASCVTVLMLTLFQEKRHRIKSRQLKVLDRSETTLLTLFTTIKEIEMKPRHRMAFNIVMTNWPSFAPFIRPVLFLNFTDSTLAVEAIGAGWDVLPLRGTNPAGTPFLKDMYRTVFDRYESVFYGFANADILYDDSLVETLLEIQRRSVELRNNVLVVGRRTNVNVNSSFVVDREEFAKSRLSQTADAKGKLFIDCAIDYFLFTREGCSMNWSNISNVVIGRPAYDNYLVAMAKSHGVNVIDATQTILAVHLLEKGVYSSGALNRDGAYNRKVIGKFVYANGVTSRAEFATAYGTMNEVVILRRGRRSPKTPI